MLDALDLLKAFFTAVGILFVNVAISFLVVAIYALLIEPGREDGFYEAAAQQIAPWSSVVAGIFLFFFAAYVMAKRAPNRNAIGFAITVWVFYAAIDLAVLVSQQALIPLILVASISLISKLAAAVYGAYRADLRSR